MLSQSLMNDPILEKEIITRAKDYVKKHHSWEGERKTYQNLVLRLQWLARLQLTDLLQPVEHFNDGKVISFGFLLGSF